MNTQNIFLHLLLWVIGVGALALPTQPDNVDLYLSSQWCGACAENIPNTINIESPVGMQLAEQYDIQTVPASISMNLESFIDLTQNTDIYEEVLEEALLLTLETAEVHIKRGDDVSINFSLENCWYTPLEEFTVKLNTHEVYDEGVVYYFYD